VIGGPLESGRQVRNSGNGTARYFLVQPDCQSASKLIGLSVLLLVGSPVMRAADPQQLALVVRAQSDFERVERTRGPELPDAARCEQSQAALLAVAPRTEVSSIHFRKGYCALIGATISHSKQGFQEAAGEFEQAIQAWSDRTPPGRNIAPERVSSGLLVLAAIARLDAGAGAGAAARELAGRDIAAAVDPAFCTGNLLPGDECRSVLEAGRVWLAALALDKDDLYQATTHLAGLSESAWGHWASGKRAFRDRQYAEAAAQYQRAVDLWMGEQRDPSASLAVRLAPRLDLDVALTDWGGAQFLSGNWSQAIATLSAAVKADPHLARALYLRGRAEERSGMTEAALADYSLASRTALADAQDLSSGEAHLYRGVLLYRRKDYAHAEDEFSSALNFDISTTLRPDAEAWRHMAAVAAGSCGSSRTALEESLTRVTPYFPKDEARALAAACPLGGSGV